MRIFQIFLIGLIVFVAGCTQVDIEPDEQGVIVLDQEIDDSTVIVDTVTASQDGWIVIHRDQNGAPGDVIGYAMVNEGVNTNIEVEIDIAQATPVLYAMLHRDAGNLDVYEFPGDDMPITVNGSLIMDRFEVTGLDMENRTGGEEGSLRIIEMRNIEFVPQRIEVNIGDTVMWKNEDNVLHTVTGFGVDENIGSGESFSYTFDEAGTYNYVCTIHPGMDGIVIVNGDGGVINEDSDGGIY